MLGLHPEDIFHSRNRDVHELVPSQPASQGKDSGETHSHSEKATITAKCKLSYIHIASSHIPNGKAVTVCPPKMKWTVALFLELIIQHQVENERQEISEHLHAYLHHCGSRSFAHGQVEIPCTFPTPGAEGTRKWGKKTKNQKCLLQL